MKSVRVYPSPTLNGTVRVPGDKSISHRAVMLAALSDGKSILRGLLLGQDVLATIACFRALGVRIEILPEAVEVDGVGLSGLKAPDQVLDCGNSGTTMRLMMGILAGQPFTTRLTGDASLNRRPMDRVIQPLKKMGAAIEELRASETERVVKIEGRPLTGIAYRLPMASAQVKSAVLLAGLYAKGKTSVEEPIPTRDHTEILLRHKGVSLERVSGKVGLAAPENFPAGDLDIPGDISSAAFFLVAACLGQGSEILLKGVGVNPTRTGILQVLEKMGAGIVKSPQQSSGGEEIADLRAGSSPLRGTTIRGALIPRLIDEIPILSVAAAAASGVTEVRDAEELRVKETDRIQSLEEELGKFSVNIEGRTDGLRIQGPTAFRPGRFHSHSDHRMAMSLAIAATLAPSESLIEDVECVQTSYPDFFEDLKNLGGKLTWVD